MHLPAGTVIDERYALDRAVRTDHACWIEYIGTHKWSQTSVFIQEYFPAPIARRGEDGHVHPASGDVQSVFEKGRRWFANETRVLYEVHHPHCVATHAPFFANGTTYRVANIREGGLPLDVGIARKGRIAESSAHAILTTVLRALRVAHEQDLIHGRISPSAIYLRPDGYPILGRFQEAAWRTMQSLDCPEKVLHKEYSAPELYAKHGIVGPWTDIYGWAATFGRLAIGEPPPSMQERQNGASVSAWLSTGNRLSSETQEILRRALAINTGERPQSVQVLLSWITDQDDEDAFDEKSRKEAVGFAARETKETDGREPRSGSSEGAERAGDRPAANLSSEMPNGTPGRNLPRYQRALIPWLVALVIVLVGAGMGFGVWKGAEMLLTTSNPDAPPSEYSVYLQERAQGDIQLAAGDYARAIDHYARALDIYAEDEYVRGQLQHAARRATTQAPEAFIRHLAQGNAHAARGDSLQEAGATGEAIRAYQEARDAYQEAQDHGPNDEVDAYLDRVDQQLAELGE